MGLAQGCRRGRQPASHEERGGLPAGPAANTTQSDYAAPGHFLSILQYYGYTVYRELSPRYRYNYTALEVGRDDLEDLLLHELVL